MTEQMDELQEQADEHDKIKMIRRLQKEIKDEQKGDVLAPQRDIVVYINRSWDEYNPGQVTQIEKELDTALGSAGTRLLEGHTSTGSSR